MSGGDVFLAGEEADLLDDFLIGVGDFLAVELLGEIVGLGADGAGVAIAGEDAAGEGLQGMMPTPSETQRGFISRSSSR